MQRNAALLLRLLSYTIMAENSDKNVEFLPPYADVGVTKKLSDPEKVQLLTTKWTTAHKFKFPDR